MKKIRAILLGIIPVIAIALGTRQLVLENQYTRLLEAHERRDYEEMLRLSGIILRLASDYKDTRLYLATAERGGVQLKAAKEEQALRKRFEQLRAEVEALERKGDLLMKGVKDPTVKKELLELIQSIYQKDPNNRKAQEWQRRLRKR